MKIETKISHNITFNIQAFEDTGCGMETMDYGKTCGDIGAAVEELRMAKSSQPSTDWIITCDVVTNINSYEPKEPK